MACVDVRTAPGDVYFLEDDVLLVYGSQGIELRLNSRNLANVMRARTTLEVVRDEDAKRRRFNVRWDDTMREIIWEPAKGETVRTPEWMLFETQKMAA